MGFALLIRAVFVVLCVAVILLTRNFWLDAPPTDTAIWYQQRILVILGIG